MTQLKDSKRCKNCGHIVTQTEKGPKHKQPNHSFYCPCRKAEEGWTGNYPPFKESVKDKFS